MARLTALAVGIAAAMVIPTAALAAETPPCTDTAATERDAARIAKACNRFVEVSSSVSERSRVVALPSGVLEWQEFAVPVRVRRGDGWVPVDTALQVFADGRIGPRASTVDIRFSPGGSGSLVTMSAGGGSASLSWPTALPAPVLEGDTAVYREVAADIDLRLRATATGFTHVLVIKTAAAAANPMLRAIRYGWSTQGLQLRTRADGGVDIADSAGAVVLSAAPGSMWDSGPGTPTGARARMLAGAEGTTVTGDGSDSTGPGDFARVAPVAVQVSASALTVVPDESMLSAPDVVFPLFIDPPVNANKNRWGYANNNGNNRNDGVARVGKDPDGSGIYRSYFEFNVSGLAGKVVYDARFYTRLTHSSPCASTPVSLWTTSFMDSGVNGTRTGWAPTMYKWLDEKSGRANKNTCGHDPMNMEFGNLLAGEVKWWADNNGKMTLGLATYNQSGYGEGVDYWKKFDPGAPTYLVAWYNTHPNTPVAQDFASSECFTACTSTTGKSTSVHQAQGWWKLDETSGTTAADAASPAHPLSKAGSGTVGWAEGGATFNNAYLQASTKVLDTTKSFTVSAWAKLSGTNNFHTIVSQDGTSGSGFHLRFDWGHQRWAFIRQATDSTDPAGAYATSIAAPTLNVWTHLVGVYVNEGREKSATLYVNGVRQSTVWADPVFSANYGLQVGRAKWAGGVSDVFAGGIDNVQVYQRQLKDADVSTLHGAGRTGALHITPAQVRTATPTLKVQASDADANAQIWTEIEVRTAPTETATLLQSSGGMGPHLSPATPSMTVSPGKFSSGGTYYWRARSADELGWYGFWSAFQAVKVDTSPPTFGSPPVASTQYPEKKWGAVVGTAGNFTFKASSDTTEFEWWLDSSTTHFTVKGGDVSNGIATVSYTPATDMVHVLHVTGKDIAGNVMATQYDFQFWVAPLSQKYSYWNLNEASGATAADSGTGGSELRPGTLAGGAVFAEGYLGNGVNFPGSGSRVSTGGPVLDTTKDFTAMAWVRPSDLAAAGTQTVLAQAGTTHSRFEVQFQQAANGGFGGWCYVMTGTSSGGGSVTACMDATRAPLPADGEWAHVTATYSAPTGVMQIFVNGGRGSCSGDFLAKTAPAAWSATGAFEIGRGWSGGGGVSYFRGDIDDVYAHQRVLAASEICQQALK